MKKIVRETCVAGAVIDQTIKGSYKHYGRRKPNTNPTPEAVMKNNMRIAVKNLARKINANFYPGDYHLTLTYKGDEPTRQVAERELRNFLNRMKREFRKQEKELRYISVTEYKNHRIHHHVVMNYIDLPIIQRQWKRGMVRFTPFDTERDYTKLADYLIKETDKTFRDPANAVKQRYSCSRNLVTPIVKREWVSVKQLKDDPKPIKGYEIIEESIRRYEHPYTQLEHLEFRMIATDSVPRIRTWRKGKVATKGETYKRAMAIKDQEAENTNDRSEWGTL